MLKHGVPCCRRFLCSHMTRNTYTTLSSQWSDLDLHPALLQRLADVNFTQPTPIQALSIPHILRGRHTVCHAETGCGKTLCYLLPLVNQLLLQEDSATRHSAARHQQTQFLVFAPTPELGLQISQMFEHIRPPELGKTPPHLWEGLREGRSFVDTTSPLIITTFSKLRDYDYYKLFGHIPTIVMDEADVYHTPRLKNLTFRVLGELVDPLRYHKVTKQLPKPKQLVYVAATLNTFQKDGSGNNIQRWLRFHHINPIIAKSDNAHVTPSSMTTFWRYVEDEDFSQEILNQIEDFYCSEEYGICDNVPEGFGELEDAGPREGEIKINIPEHLPPIAGPVLHTDRKMLIFLNSAESVNVLYRNVINYLKQSPCETVKALARRVYRLSGSLSREERAAVIKRIQRGSIRILIASDVASRGLDIPNLDMVINAQLPVDSIGYLHRAGRTARMGRQGTVLNFLSLYDAPLYQQIYEVERREVPRYNDTMKTPPRASKLPGPKGEVEEKEGRGRRPRRTRDPWLDDTPVKFSSKIYRNDFEI